MEPHGPFGPASSLRWPLDLEILRGSFNITTRLLFPSQQLSARWLDADAPKAVIPGPKFSQVDGRGAGDSGRLGESVETTVLETTLAGRAGEPSCFQRPVSRLRGAMVSVR